DLELTLLAMTQDGCERIRSVRQTHSRQRPPGIFHDRVVLGCIPKPVERARLAGLRRQPAVFKGAESGKYIDLLIAAADAQARALFRREVRYLHAAVQNAASAGRQIAREQIDQSRFSRSIGTDDRVQRSGADFERHVIDRGESAEALR